MYWNWILSSSLSNELKDLDTGSSCVLYQKAKRPSFFQLRNPIINYCKTGMTAMVLSNHRAQDKGDREVILLIRGRYIATFTKCATYKCSNAD